MESTSEIDGAAVHPSYRRCPKLPSRSYTIGESLANKQELVNVLTGSDPLTPVDTVNAATVTLGPEPSVEKDAVPDPFHPRSCPATRAALRSRQTSLRSQAHVMDQQGIRQRGPQSRRAHGPPPD